jgi:hypothetical protein
VRHLEIFPSGWRRVYPEGLKSGPVATFFRRSDCSRGTFGNSPADLSPGFAANDLVPAGRLSAGREFSTVVSLITPGRSNVQSRHIPRIHNHRTLIQHVLFEVFAFGQHALGTAPGARRLRRINARAIQEATLIQHRLNGRPLMRCKRRAPAAQQSQRRQCQGRVAKIEKVKPRAAGRKRFSRKLEESGRLGRCCARGRAHPAISTTHPQGAPITPVQHQRDCRPNIRSSICWRTIEQGL